ncbi:MAG: hypothetical protein U5O39_13255 [Gammaproteobacteria bacterium]|nr:hypothetical protein [Gammaproteobacteria bacterium]
MVYGPHGIGKREQGVQVEEGGDMEFEPDVVVKHGDVIDEAAIGRSSASTHPDTRPITCASRCERKRPL